MVAPSRILSQSKSSTPGESLTALLSRAVHRTWRDATIGVLLFGTAYFCGTAYVRASVAGGVRPEFYQTHYGPAVMVACGYGYASPIGVPALEAFLRSERDAFSCTDLPPHPQSGALTGPQVTWRYLIYTAGLVWRVTGVSWAALVATLSGIFFGSTATLAYALARLFAGRVLAASVGAAVLTSPLHLQMLPHLRDYSKAPFMLALWMLLGLLVAAPMKPRRVLALAAAYGLVLAIGSGFRNDLLIAAPPFVLAIAFLPDGARANIGLKAKALAIMAAVFLVAGWPLLGAYAEGGGASMQHVAILGLTTHFDEPLNVAPSVYEVGHSYDDSFAAGLITNYASRRQHGDGPITLYDRRYDRAASAMIRDVMATFPADVLARAYASTITIVGLPTSTYLDGYPPPFLRAGSLVERFYEQRTRALYAVDRLWPAASILALLLASAISMRIAAFVALAALYFASYPAVQFAERHYFHLNIITPAAVAFVLHRVVTLIPWPQRPRRPQEPPRPQVPPRQFVGALGRSAARVTAFAGGALLALAAPLLLARAYQDRHVALEIKRRLAAVQQPVQFTARDAGARTALDVMNLPAEREAGRMPGTARSEYLVVQLGGPRCALARVPVRIQYDKPFEEGGFTQTVWADIPADEQAATTLLVPVFFRVDPGLQSTRFRGLELPRGDDGCVARLARIQDQGQFGLLFGAVLPPDWRSFPLHQRLSALEPHFVSRYPTFIARPTDLRLTRRLLTAPLVVPATMFRAEDLHQTPAGTLTMNVVARAPMDYLLQFRTVQLEPQGRIVVQGYIGAGGLTVGLLRDNRWYLQAQVTQPGPFVVVLATDTPYPESLVVANNVQNGSMKTDFEITRAGWLPSDPPP